MKIALFFIYTDDMTISMEDIGFSMISSVIQKQGHEVKEIFINEKNIDYQELVCYKPDVAAFTVYTMAKTAIYNVIEKIIAILPKIKVIVGGVHATCNDIEILEENNQIDFVVRGEGEITIQKLLDCIEIESDYESIQGLTYRINNSVYRNPDRAPIENLDNLPFASRDVLKHNALQVALLSTSRGCNSRCTFCSSQMFWKKWRGRSVPNCLDEIEIINEQYGISVFNFIDSSFEDPYIDLRRIKEIAQGILDRNLHISYFIDVRAEINRRLTDETMLLLKKSGLIAVCIGIEAGNEQDLKLYNKIANIEDNHKVIEMFQSYDVSISPGFINFNPYSNLQTLRQNIGFLRKYGYSIRFFTFLDIYKGTTLYNKVCNDSLFCYKPSENYEFNYKYIDETAMKIAQYFYKYKKQLNYTPNRYFNKMDFYFEIYPHLLGYYKRELLVNQSTEALQVLENHVIQYKQIRKSFDQRCAHWINSVLDASQIEYDENLLDEIKNEYMDENYFISIVESFNNIKNTLYVQLSRLGQWKLLKNL